MTAALALPPSQYIVLTPDLNLAAEKDEESNALAVGPFDRKKRQQLVRRSIVPARCLWEVSIVPRLSSASFRMEGFVFPTANLRPLDFMSLKCKLSRRRTHIDGQLFGILHVTSMKASIDFIIPTY